MGIYENFQFDYEPSENRGGRCRDGEQAQTRFRSDRFCRVNGEWFFLVRDEAPQGPFRTRQEADAELAFYLRTLCLMGKASIELESPKHFWSVA